MKKIVSRLTYTINRSAFGEFKPKYGFGLFNFKQVKSEAKQNLEKMKILQQQLKDYKEEKRFMIRRPFEKDYFMSTADREKQASETRKALDKYLSEYKFEKPFIEDNFIALLSMISQTVDNKNILESIPFQDLILERAEKAYLFKDFRQFCLFYTFCAVQCIDHTALWECFNGFVANNYKEFTIVDKVLLLQHVNDVNRNEFECFFEIFENELLKDIQKESVPNFEKIHALLQLYRNSHQGSDDFYETLEQITSENINEISIPNLTLLTTHYATNTNEKHASRLRMMEVFEKRILKIVQFINAQELIALFFCYTKLGQGSEELFEQMEERIFLLIDQFPVKQINKLLVIASNRPASKFRVFMSVEAYVLRNLDKLNEHTIPEIFFSFSENAIGTEKFYTAIENKLVTSAHLMNPEMISKCSWGFAMAKTNKGSLFFRKAQEASLGRLKDFSVKDLSTLVWSFARFQNGDTEFYRKIETEIQSRFETLKAKDCAQLLWAYIQNHPLTMYTVEVMRGIILRDRHELDCWDLSIILWSFTKFEQYESYQMYKDLESQVLELIDEMTSEEFLYTLRSFIEMKAESQDLVDVFVGKAEECLNLKQINYEQVHVLIWGFSSMSQVEITSSIIELIKKLEIRLKELQMLVNAEEDNTQQQNDPFKINDIEFYQQNLEKERSETEKEFQKLNSSK